MFINIVICSSSLKGNDWNEIDNKKLSETNQEYIFVSLGSNCIAAHVLRACGIRRVAFPFDWIVSHNSEGFLRILEDDFAYFFDHHFLSVVDSGVLLNTYYRLEFIHDGNFREHLTMEKFQSKFQRRIERFRQLKNFSGKVYFLRFAYQKSMVDGFYHCAENVEISDEYALRLYSLIEKRNPNLDFTLIIINHHNGIDLYEEKRLANNLIILRNNPNFQADIIWDNYKKYFNILLDESNLHLKL